MKTQAMCISESGPKSWKYATAMQGCDKHEPGFAVDAPEQPPSRAEER